MIGFVEKVVDATTVLVRSLSSDEVIKVKADKFSIEEYKELLKDENVIIVTVNEDTETIIDTVEI